MREFFGRDTAEGLVTRHVIRFVGSAEIALELAGFLQDHQTLDVAGDLADDTEPVEAVQARVLQ